MALERDPGTPLELTALTVEETRVEFEVPADGAQVWFMLYPAPLTPYLARLGPQAHDPDGRLLPKTDRSYAISHTATDSATP